LQNDFFLNFKLKAVRLENAHIVAVKKHVSRAGVHG